MMTRKKPIKFISEFLIPSLNTKRFGSRLIWLDEEKKVFQMDWCHKAGPKWTEREAEVFVEWDKHKGHFKPEEKEYYTKSKQRFRAMLYKLTIQGSLIPKSASKFKKVYSIGEYCKQKRRSTSSSECSESTYDDETEYMGDSDEKYLESEECSRLLLSNDCAWNIFEEHSYTIHHSNIPDRVLENDVIFEPTQISLYNEVEYPEKVRVEFLEPYSKNQDQIDLSSANIHAASEAVIYMDIVSCSRNEHLKASDFDEFPKVPSNFNTSFHCDLASNEENASNHLLLEEPEMCCNFDFTTWENIVIADILDTMGGTEQNGLKEDSALL